MAIYKLVKNTNNQYILLIAAGIILFFIFAYPKLVQIEGMHQENFKTTVDKCHKIDQMICSPACISGQFPISFEADVDPRIKPGDVGTKYIPTNYMCTGKYGQGSVCIPKKSLEHLKYRGGNAL
jgi:hypothetical protein